ncbi:MAG: VanZ family protein [Opitutaceae bacterium]|nr:VanZ family protein [Opitutaceae bacterium]
MRTSERASNQPRSLTLDVVSGRSFRPLRLLWPLLLAAVVFYASGRSHVAGPGLTRVDDKIGHFLAYGLFATLLCRAFGAHGRGALIALLLASAYGASDEWHQSFVPGRNSELADWIADTLGAALAVGLYTWVTPYRRLLEAPLWRRGKAHEG